MKTRTLLVSAILAIATLASSSCAFTETYTAIPAVRKGPDGKFQKTIEYRSRITRVDEPTQMATFNSPDTNDRTGKQSGVTLVTYYKP